MTIECKKSNTHAWIFFTLPSYTQFIVSGQYLDFLEIHSREASLSLRLLYPKRRIHYNKFERVASSYAEIKLKKARDKKASGKQEIFEAVNQLVKFVRYKIKENMDRFRKNVDLPLILLFFNVLVFDGTLYEAIVSDGGVNLIERDHILLNTHYRPSYYESSKMFKIDIVKKEYLPKLLNEIEHDISFLNSEIISQRQNLMGYTNSVLPQFFKKIE